MLLLIISKTGLGFLVFVLLLICIVLGVLLMLQVLKVQEVRKAAKIILHFSFSPAQAEALVALARAVKKRSTYYLLQFSPRYSPRMFDEISPPLFPVASHPVDEAVIKKLDGEVELAETACMELGITKELQAQWLIIENNQELL